MEIIGKLIGFLLFVGAIVGIYYLLKGRGRLEKLDPTAWSKLESQFAVATMPAAHTYTSGLIGLAKYEGSLKLAYDQTGVYLDVPDLARFGKKPVHIPYNEFVVSTKNPTLNYGVRTYTQFVVRDLRVCIEKDQADTILARRAAIP